MVNLIGVKDHNTYQLVTKFRKPNDDLRNCLKTLLQTNAVDLLAEEMTADAKKTLGFKSFVCVEVANSFNIKHRFIEMDKQTRKQQKVASEDHDAREAYWLSRIQDTLDNDGSVLFVCGAAHIASFSTLLAAKGYKNKIVAIIGED